MSMDISQLVGRPYQIVSVAMRRSNLTASDDRNVFLLEGENGPEHDWEFIDAENGQVLIRSLKSQNVLAVEGGSKEDHAPIIQEPENGQPAQLWTLEPTGPGAWQIRSVNSQKVLSISPLRIFPPRVDQMEFRRSPDQEWLIQPVGE